MSKHTLVESQTLSLDNALERGAAWIASGAKPRAEHRIGIEHEKAVYDSRSAPYSYTAGIKPLLDGAVAMGYSAIDDGGNIIGAKKQGAAITLEPGGQVELSGAPLKNIHAAADELREHFKLLAEVAPQAKVSFAGYRAFEGLDSLPFMPKRRHQIMRSQLPPLGGRALHMMLGTCTAQANFDYVDEADMIRKFRLGLKLAPVAAAMFANSPYASGRATGYLSTRVSIWRDVDPARCGFLPFVFDDNFSYQRYAEYVLSVPMFFYKRGDTLFETPGRSLLSLIQNPPGGFVATLEDFELAASMVFPELRLKKYLEVRSTDVGPPSSILALGAWYTGLFYGALSEAEALVEDLQSKDLVQGLAFAAQDGLQGRLGGRPIWEWASALLEISKKGLRTRRILRADGEDESIYLQPIAHWVETRCSPARRWRKRCGAVLSEKNFKDTLFSFQDVAATV